MRRSWRNLTMRQPAFSILVGAIIALGETTGCSAVGRQILSANLEGRLASNGTADDHLVAAMLYQQQAEKHAETAAKFERRAAELTQLLDTKGFRRAGLITAAQEHRKKAEKMQQLYAAHHNIALTLMGKNKQE